MLRSERSGMKVQDESLSSTVTGSVLFHGLPADPDRSQDWDRWQNFVTPRSPVLYEYPGSYNQDLWRWEEVRKTRIDVYETLCPQQMLVHKGGKIKNWGGEMSHLQIAVSKYI